MQTAFGVTLNNYLESAQDAATRGPQAQPYTFFASSTPVQIPAALDGKVTSVEGLENYTRPLPRLKKKFTVSGPFDAVVARNAYGLGTIYGAGLTGTGRTVGISNFDGVNPATNAPLYINRNGLPYPAAGKGSNIQRITVSGSNGTSGQAEGDLDFQAVLGMAPLSNIIIYDSTNSLLAVLTREATDNTADILTESYGWALSASTATSCHNQHTIMTTQGQTYLCASGDNGNIQTPQATGSGGTAVFDYPDYDPDVTNIGGTILTANNGPGYSYASETGWSGSGGLYSTSTVGFNVLPSWQKGRNVPTTNKRLVPDIASHAAAPNSAYIIYYGNGTLTGISGTSCSSPVDAGSLALVEQYMINQGGLPANSAGKRRLGRINDRIYAFNGRNDIFHDVTTGSSTAGSAQPYWDYVTGWGSVNWYNFAAALLSPLTVTVTPATTTLNAGQTVNLTANVTGSNVTTVTWSVASGPGTISSTGVYTAPASVAATTTVTVKAVSTIDTANAGTTTAAVQPNPVFGTATITINPSTRNISGFVSLDGIADPSLTVVPMGTFTFVLTPVGGSPITQTATLGSGGSFTLSGVPAGSYTLTVQGSKWLKEAITVDASGGDVSNANISLPGGDADSNNVIDIADFGLLVNAYGSVQGANTAYNTAADFNCDGTVDIADFGILVNNYGQSGAM